MARHNEIGRIGEDLARKKLMDEGYLILESNWRHGHLEADIIAYKDNTIVFIEVKTRSDNAHGNPESFVDRNKQRAYIRLANTYILRNNRQEEARFDIISVSFVNNEPQINHIEDAFRTTDFI